MNIDMVKKLGKQRTPYGQPVEEEIQEETVPRNLWPIPTRSRILYSNNWKLTRRNSVDDGMLLRMKITLNVWPNKITSTTKTNGGFIQPRRVLTSNHWEIVLVSSKRCLLCNDYKKQDDYNKKRERTIRVYLLLQTQRMAVGTRFTFYMEELAMFMVDSLSFLRSRRRSTKYWVNGATCCLQYLARFFGEGLSLIQFVTVGSFTAWRQCTVTDEGVKTTPQMTRFRDAKFFKQLATDEKWRSQNAVWLQVQKWTTESRRKELYTGCCDCVVKPSTTSMTTWPPRPRVPSTQRTWISTREWYTRYPMCA